MINIGRKLLCALFLKGCGVLCVLLVGSLPVQGANLDSLYQVYAQMEDDSLRFTNLLLLTGQYRSVDTEKALQLAEDIVAQTQAKGDPVWMAQAYSNLGTTQYYTSQFSTALENYGKAQELFEKLGLQSEVLKVLVNVGSVYINLHNYDRSGTVLEEALRLVSDSTPLPVRSILNTNLGIVRTEQERYEEALELYQQNLALLPEDDYHKRCLTYSNLGYTYDVMEDLDQALVYYQLALSTARKAQASYETGYALDNVIQVLIRQGKFEQAQTKLDTLGELAREYGSPQLIAQVVRTRANLAEKQGQLKEALRELKSYIGLKDSLFSEDQNKLIAESQAKMDMARKEAELAMMEKASLLQGKETAEKGKFIFWLAIGFGLLLAAVMLLIIQAASRMRVYRELLEKNRLIREQYELLHQQKVRLEDLNREKDGLIGVVAHDLKSPLSKSLALASMIESGGELTETQKGALEMVKRVNKAGEELIRDLLDLSMSERPEVHLNPEEVNLTEFLEEVQGTFAGVVSRKNLQVNYNLEGRTSFRTDRNALGRITENLLSNAIKFSPPDKEIFVEMKAVEGELVLRIRDQGPGMGPEDHKKLFKRFQRLSARPTGGEHSTGLGLAITKALVDTLGGVIEVESEPGMGAEFRVNLPELMSAS